MEIKDKLERYKKFYAQKEPGTLLIKTQFPVEGSTSATYTDFDLNTWDGVKQYYRAAIQSANAVAQAHEDLEDDSIPELFSHLGTGVGGAFFDDVPVVFTPETSWAHASIHSYSELDRLDPERDTPWAARFKEIAMYLKERCADRLCVAPVMHFSPLDAANSLRGNELFTDFYEYPEELKRLLQYCTDVTLRLAREFGEIVGDVEGGQSMWNVWIPGRNAVGMMEDTSNLCSSETYLCFGRSYTEQIIGRYGGFVHNHMLGVHQFGQISSLKGLGVMNVANDPKCPRVLEALDQIAGNLSSPINFECTFDELRENLERLHLVRAILWVHCSGSAQAKEAVRIVRQISRISA